jgi:hypothetical protein
VSVKWNINNNLYSKNSLANNKLRWSANTIIRDCGCYKLCLKSIYKVKGKAAPMHSKSHTGTLKVYHHHDHHHVVCTVLGLVTFCGPINSPEVSWGVSLGFVSHTVVISQLSVAVCLSPFAEHVVSIYFRNFEFSLQISWRHAVAQLVEALRY